MRTRMKKKSNIKAQIRLLILFKSVQIWKRNQNQAIILQKKIFLGNKIKHC
jgi:hypothetical protein